MRFQLLKKNVGVALTVYCVKDSADDSVVGHITVRNEESSDLEKHWLGSDAKQSAPAGSLLASAFRRAEASALRS